MKHTAFITLIIFLFFISCKRAGNSDNKVASLAGQTEILATDAGQPSPAPAEDKKQFQQIPVNNGQPGDSISVLPTPMVRPDWDKKIIKTANLRVEVNNFKTYSAKLQTSVKQYGGYIASEEQTHAENRTESVVSVKIPVMQFESFINELSSGEVKVSERKISSEDVTGEVVDTRSRLEAKRQMRMKYLEFLKQSKNMEEVLQVQGEINSIQEEIESASARVQLLSQQAAYSTVNLTYFQPLAGYKPTDESPSFFKRVSAAFGNGGHMVAEFFVGLISVWPLLLIIAAIYVGYKKLRPATVVTRNQ